MLRHYEHLAEQVGRAALRQVARVKLPTVYSWRGLSLKGCTFHWTCVSMPLGLFPSMLYTLCESSCIWGGSNFEAINFEKTSYILICIE